MVTGATGRKYQREAIEAYLLTLQPGSAIEAAVHGETVQHALAAFERVDADAIRYQSRYRRTGLLALVGTTMGTLIGACLLIPLDPGSLGLSRGHIGILQTLGLVTGFAAIQWIGWRKPVDRWMANRAEAERLRGTVFQAIVDAPLSPGLAGTEFAKDKFQLLLAAYIHDQLAYFKRTMRRHEQAASRLSPLRVAGVLLTGLAVLLGLGAVLLQAASLGMPLPDGLRSLAEQIVTSGAGRWQLSLATMASSLLAHASARSLMDQDERNVALYRRTTQKVNALLAAQTSAVAAAVAQGDTRTLHDFFSEIRQTLEEEHVAWFDMRPPVDPKIAPAVRVR